jgi:hypothetical protein
VHRLPECIAQRQRQALERRYNGDTTCIEACSKLHLCIQCVARKGTIQGIRLRHDCQSGELVCMHCGPGTVLSIHMLGSLVTVVRHLLDILKSVIILIIYSTQVKDRLLLSSCCGSFIYYGGSGNEYNTHKCGIQCTNQRQLFGKRERTTAAAAKSAASSNNARPMHHCFVCNQRNGIQQTIQLLDPRERAIVPYGLCSKHVLPHHISATIFDTEALLLYFRQQQLSNPLHHKKTAKKMSKKKK